MNLTTNEAYDQWASVYDNDGNILQRIDDSELTSLLPQLCQTLLDTSPSPSPTRPIILVDHGCGTGRTTLKLLTFPWPPHRRIHIVGIDASTNMLGAANAKIAHAAHQRRIPSNVTYKLIQHDFLHPSDPRADPVPLTPRALLPPDWSGVIPHRNGVADAVCSTLVLEHFPREAYFASIGALLAPTGVGLALVTNMHAEMGKGAQAGFRVVREDGLEVKVRGVSWVHTVEETVEGARGFGFELLGEVREVEVEEGMVERLGRRSQKWVGVKVWYGGIWKKHS